MINVSLQYLQPHKRWSVLGRVIEGNGMARQRIHPVNADDPDGFDARYASDAFDAVDPGPQEGQPDRRKWWYRERRARHIAREG